MSRLRVLVVEDNAIIGMLLADMIARMGHDVCAVERTEDGAISAALRFRPDLMIVDEHLAEGSGAAAVEAVRRTWSVPHIFISGAEMSSRRSGSIVLRKPFLAPDLALAIGRAMVAATA